MDKKIVKDLKKFSLISNIAYNVIVTLIMGVGLGLLLDYLFDKRYWTPICSVIFMFIAIINFINMIVKITKLDDKENKKQ